MTMGSKTKAILDVEIFDNRFKVFTCVGCGNVTMFSNKIKCDGKNCDTSYF
jgi:predicted nucleic-acid-binding Zn-ribbon protein